MRFLFCFTLLLLLYTFLHAPTYANSGYVLPYPSFMPGSKFYLARTLWEKLSYYWHFGSFSQFKYNLNQADKYLVEAKTLFEYDQFLLGRDALKKSDYYFEKIDGNLIEAKREQKNISEKKNTLHKASQKHIEVLENIIRDVPEQIEWKPEKAKAIRLLLHKDLLNSVEIRRKVL